MLRTSVPLLCLAGLFLAIGLGVTFVVFAPFQNGAIPEESRKEAIAEIVAEVDRSFAKRWKEEGLIPAEPAEENQVLRRLTLALHGRIPSLEEIRAFGSDRQPDRLRRWTVSLMDDERFARYFGSRMAKTLLGNKREDFPRFQPDRFADWMGRQIAERRPYDEVARAIISAKGLGTQDHAGHFIFGEVGQGELYAQRLAGRTVRAFLGQRIDCAQCHNHPFDHWTQKDFEGLAGYFGQIRVKTLGIEDPRYRRLEIEDHRTLETRKVEPEVPFGKERLPSKGTFRERLAEWVTHSENRRFRRATVNRVWGLMLGRPYYSPVDEIPDPYPLEEPDETALLELLGEDLKAHQYDLRRLILIISHSRVFRMASVHPQMEEMAEDLEELWGVFPLTRLRPEQMYRSLEQVSSIQSVRAGGSPIPEIQRWMQERRFVQDVGALEDDLDEQVETVPDTLIRMNGNVTRRFTRTNFANASGRIAAIAREDENCLDTCYQVCLCRSPSAEEKQHFLAQLSKAKGHAREMVIEDLFWTLVNSPEFSWNH